MKLTFRIGAVCAAILFSNAVDAGAQTAATPTRATQPVADSLRAVAYRMVDLLRKLDVHGAIALYGDTSHFVHVENGTVIPWSQMASMMRSYFSTAKRNPLSVVGEPGVTLIDANNAVVYVSHHFDANEGQPAHDGVWTGVMHRFREGWRIVHSHSSDRAKR